MGRKVTMGLRLQVEKSTRSSRKVLTEGVKVWLQGAHRSCIYLVITKKSSSSLAQMWVF